MENGDRGSTQNFAARLVSIVVWPGEQFLRKFSNFKKCILFDSGHVQKNPEITIFPEQKPRRELQDTKELFRIRKSRYKLSKMKI